MQWNPSRLGSCLFDACSAHTFKVTHNAWTGIPVAAPHMMGRSEPRLHLADCGVPCDTLNCTHWGGHT